jgi:hypothetical protein
MKRLRKLVLVLAALFVAAGCTADGKLAIAKSGASFAPFMAGMSADEFEGYLTWWRGSGASYEPRSTTNLLPIDPRCPLRFDYDLYRAQQGGRPEISPSGATDGIYLQDVTYGNGFFHRTDRVEALFVLYGTTQAGNSATAYSCAGPDDDRRKSYIPVRINLRDGTYVIEGWVNPSATVEVEASLAAASAPVKKDSGGVWDDAAVDEIYSPLRLDRFALTDENIARVLAYARIKEGSAGGKATARRIHWFRVSDLAPYYRSLGKGGCAAAYAFYEKFDAFSGDAKGLCALGDPLAIGRNGQGASSISSDLYLDKMGRMGDTANAVESAGRDDNCNASATSGVCSILQGGSDSGAGVGSENDWEFVARQLAIVNGTASTKGSSGQACTDGRSCGDSAKRRAAALAAIRDRFRDRGAILEFTSGASSIPAELGGAVPDTDVIGIIAGHGQDAWDDTKEVLEQSPALKRFGSFVGSTATAAPDTAIVTPSFVISEVGATTEAQQAWLEQHSALFGGSATRASLMRFRTSSGDTLNELSYRQGPIGRISIRVTGGTLRGEGVTYVSDYLPYYAIGRPGGEGQSLTESYLPFDPRAIVQALNGFIVSVYEGTLGAAMAELSSSAVDGILATPGLNRYELDLSYSTPDRPIYQLNGNVDQALLRETSLGELPAKLKTLEPTVAACTYAAANGILNGPGNDDEINPAAFVYPEGTDTDKTPSALRSVTECYVGNPVYGLFEIGRAISLILFMVLVARFFFRLGTGREREMGIMGFFARAAIAMAIIIGAAFVLQVGATIVSEAITLTNFFGTQLSGGRPYSYLWLFGGYLSRSDVTSVNVFSLFLLAPFTVLGLLVLSIVTFLRSAFTVAIIAISPFWVIDLLYHNDAKFFNRSLLLMMRLYLIPVLTLVTLMFLFLFFPASTDLAKSQTEFGLLSAVLGLAAILLVIIVPIWGANQLVGRFGDRIIGGLNKALKGARDSQKADFLEAGMRGEEGLKKFRSDIASGAVEKEREEQRKLTAEATAKRLAAGGKGAKIEGGPGAAGSLTAGAAAAAGLIGGARGLIGAERGRPKTIAERLKALSSGTSSPKEAGAKALGVASRLGAWTAKAAARGMVGAEVAATRGYAEATAKRLAAGGKTKGEAAAGAIASLAGGAGGAAGFIGGARGLIGAERGRPKTIAERLKAMSGAVSSPGQAGTSALGVASKLGAWTAKAAARGMVGAEVAATRGYAEARLEDTKTAMVARLAAAGVVDDSGAARLDTAQGRLAAAALEIGGQAKSEIAAYTTTKLTGARSAFLASVDAEQRYLAASAGVETAQVETADLQARLEAGTLVDGEAMAAQTRIATLAGEIATAERTRLESAAIMAAASSSATAAVGRTFVDLRRSSVGRAVFGSTEADLARTEAEANATAAAAVTRRIDEDTLTLRAEELACRNTGDRAGAERAAAAIAARAELRAAVEAERAAFLDDAARRTQGAAADISTEIATARTTAGRLMGRAGGTKARQKVVEAEAQIVAADAELAAVAEQEASYQDMADRGLTLTDTPDFEARRAVIITRRSAASATIAAATATMEAASTARRTAEIWNRAASGRLPDGSPARSMASFAPAAALAGTVVLGAIGGAAGFTPAVTDSIGRSTGAAIGAALDARVFGREPNEPRVPAPTTEARLRAAAGVAPVTPLPTVVRTSPEPATPVMGRFTPAPAADVPLPVSPVEAAPVVVPSPAPVVAAPAPAPVVTDWAALLATGSIDAIAETVRAGIAAGDQTAAAIGSEGVALLREAAGTGIETEIRATLAATLD